jgi:hypothetical protein
MSRLVSGARGPAGAEAAQCDQGQSCVGGLPDASHDANREAPRQVEPEGSEDDQLAPLLRAYVGGHEEEHTIDQKDDGEAPSMVRRSRTGVPAPMLHTMPVRRAPPSASSIPRRRSFISRTFLPDGRGQG